MSYYDELLRKIGLAVSAVARKIGLIAATIALFLVVKAKAFISWLPRGYGRLCAHLDRIITSGWRKAWGWLGPVLVVFTYIYAPLRHLAVDTTAVNFVLAYCTAQYGMRGVEKMASIGAVTLPGLGPLFPAPPEGGPRPAQS